MKLAVACFFLFCAWLASPLYLYPARYLELDSMSSWDVPATARDVPTTWKGVYYMSGNVQPDGSPSPLVGMDTRFCTYQASRRCMRCPMSSMLWAAEADAIQTARKLAVARFHYDFHFTDDLKSAELRAYVFGVSILDRLGLVWDIGKTGGNGAELKRCSWTRSAADRAGSSALKRLQSAGWSNRGCYSPRRAYGDGGVAAGVLKRMTRTWGSTVVRLAL
mmetsp:Transcript_5336/g.18034  ORF Transcript_5336/g.18034 Transcript_5336/m.18034 type:complete len:220 (-) Transcript_5336:474-1133(-)